MNKIQVSAVQMTANVQVVNINAYLIAKAVKAQINAHIALDGTKITEHVVDETNDEGEEIKGHEETQYDTCEIKEGELKLLHEEVLPFLDELVAAFEAE